VNFAIPVGNPPTGIFNVFKLSDRGGKRETTSKRKVTGRFCYTFCKRALAAPAKMS
jgi:hypothetical protein